MTSSHERGRVPKVKQSKDVILPYRLHTGPSTKERLLSGAGNSRCIPFYLVPSDKSRYAAVEDVAIAYLSTGANQIFHKGLPRPFGSQQRP